MIGESKNKHAVARGWSMEPTIFQGDLLFYNEKTKISCGDILIYNLNSSQYAHRLLSINSNGMLLLKGDNFYLNDPPIHSSQVIGVVSKIMDTNGRIFHHDRKKVNLFISKLVLYELRLNITFQQHYLRKMIRIMLHNWNYVNIFLLKFILCTSLTNRKK